MFGTTMAALLQPKGAPMQRVARRALVVDDHTFVAEAVALAISRMGVFDRIESARSVAEACGLLDADPSCHLAILDLHLENTEGRETLLGMRERFPEVPILVFTGDGSLENITMAFECGARGFATKNSPMSVLCHAIELVLSGSAYVPPEAVRLLGFPALPVANASSSPAPPLRLSVRQEQVFRLLLQGMPNKVIASRLEMAEGTAKAHLNAVFRLLGVRTRVEAILKAGQLGMI